MKKILALLLAVMMLAALVACDDGSLPPVDGESDSEGTGTGEGTETEAESETEEEEDEDYVPDFEAKYGGCVGVGVESGSAYFDNLKVMSKQTDKKELYYDELEGELPVLTYVTGAETDWAVAVDPTEDEDEDDPNHALGYTGSSASMVTFGSSNWNYYQYSMKVYPVDDTTVIDLYFCVTDADNYFVVSVGGNDGDSLCYQVVGGEKTAVAPSVYAPVEIGEWTSVGVTVERETIDIYIGGTKRFSLFNDEFEYSMTIANRATVNAPSCASWETPGSINDGMYPDATYASVSNGTAYGSWSMADISETISYEWDEAVTVDGIGLFFWQDKETREYWLENGGIHSASYYTIQYLDENGDYVDVENAVGLEVLDDVMNQSFFDAVTTTSIQVTLYKFTEEEDATYRFSEYKEYEANGGDVDAEDAPTDPSIRGLGLFEFEVYAAGTVERPEE